MKPPVFTSWSRGRRADSITMLTIVKDDWLSKITLKRWKTIYWDRHLKPTQETLDNRKQRGESFNPDLIYPGDTFEIIS